jgi:hypothetical protein
MLQDGVEFSVEVIKKAEGFELLTTRRQLPIAFDFHVEGVADDHLQRRVDEAVVGLAHGPIVWRLEATQDINRSFEIRLYVCIPIFVAPFLYMYSKLTGF